jgi:hypothetical protein
VPLTYAHDEFPLSLIYALEHIHLERNRCAIVPIEWAIEEQRLLAPSPSASVARERHP